MPRRIVLHIGTHKTGSTSIQHFLQDQNADLLSRARVFRPPGFLLPGLHSELPLLAIRPERSWPARIRFPATQRPAWQAAATAHVRHQVESSHEVLAYSHEDLSYLRFDDELERLRDVLAGRVVQVVIFLREKAAFLRSYRGQLEAMGFEPSDDPSSFVYVDADSWLIDYDHLLDGYRRCFGDANVLAIDYDETLRRDHSVIPAFAEVLGLEESSLPPLDTYFLNCKDARLHPSPELLDAIRRRIAQQAP